MNTADLNITDLKRVNMLGKEAAKLLSEYHWRWVFKDAQCLMKNDDHGPQGVNPPIIPYAPLQRARVYTGTRESGSYNHHSQIARFKGRYYLAFSNGLVDEEAGGQRVMISSSDDAVSWSDAVCVAGRGEGEELIAYNCVALITGDDELRIVTKREDTIIDAESTGMRRIVPESAQLLLYSSTDGKSWRETFTFDDRLDWIFEAPRLTSEGRLLCICHTKDEGPAALLWPGDEVLEQPEIVQIPEPLGARFPYGESSWYQTDEGRIVVFWRDEGGSCRLYVNFSDTGGRTFAAPMISDIPDSMSRVHAGRLADGRYYLCGNAFPTLLDRRHLMLLLSDDGSTFNEVYTLLDDPTAQRLKGLLKADGYQYPCCLPEENRLLVAYSVNKEDIECAAVDTRRFPTTKR